MNHFAISDQGWLEDVTQLPSPNCEPRPDRCDIRLIVVHGISLPPGRYGGGHIHQLFTNQLDPSQHEYFAEIQGLRVSAHCLIERDASITQFVSFDERAWHAGVSCWKEMENCNDFSIGIELEGSDDENYTEQQYQQLAKLVISLRKQYAALDEEGICGHSDIAPGRKTDPGPFFDWKKLKNLINESL